MINYYRVTDYPFIAVLNPRTGEKVHHFKKKYDKYLFCEAVTTFLSDRELPMVQDDTLDDNTDDASAADVVIDSDKKVNGINGHAQVSGINGYAQVREILCQRDFLSSTVANLSPFSANIASGKRQGGLVKERLLQFHNKEQGHTFDKWHRAKRQDSSISSSRAHRRAFVRRT